MKKVVFFIIIVFFLNSCNNVEKVGGLDYEDASKMEASQARIQFEIDKIKDPKTKEVPIEKLETARAYTQRLLESTRAIDGVNWVERGPNNVGGRTRAILIDRSDNTNNTVFAGSVGGGLWRTTNFQSTNPRWTEINPFFSNLAITCIAQDPVDPNIMYFGTGEGWSNQDAIRGLGIWRSIDGGINWDQIPFTNENTVFHWIQDIVIDNNQNVYAATRNRGVQRSTDLGNSWTQVLGLSVNVGNTNRAADLEIGTDGDIYASLGIFSAGGVFRSTNGTFGSWNDISPPGNHQRIEIATAPSNSNRVYILCQGGTAANRIITGMFRTNNKGANWTSMTIPTICDVGRNNVFARDQAWYNLIAVVDPTNADRVYIGGIDALRSNNAGVSWTQISDWRGGNDCAELGSNQYVHADHHMMLFEQGSSTRLILGTDGGIYHTTNSTASTPSFTAKNGGYNVTQFYSCAIHPTNTNTFLAGAQDNGTQKFTVSGINSTEQVAGGDGGFCHFAQFSNGGVREIYSFTYNSYRVCIAGGCFNKKFETVNETTTGRFISPSDVQNIDYLAYYLYAGHNPGKYLRWYAPGAFYQGDDSVTVSSLREITAVTVSPNTDHRVFFGDDFGQVIRVDNAHTGTSKTGIVLRTQRGEGQVVSSIAVEEGNDNHLLVTYSNYGVESIVETTNGGNTWTSIEGNLPDMPIRWIIFSPQNNDQAFIATELGVWSTADLNGGNTDWQPTNAGLANVRVDMLRYRASDGLIAAATYGRGLFTTEACPSDLNLTLSGNRPSGTYRAKNKITSTGSVPAGSNVYYKAGTRIELCDMVIDGNFVGVVDFVCYEGNLRELPTPTLSKVENIRNKNSSLLVKPNPFSTNTTIEYVLYKKEIVNISLSDMNGRVIGNLLQESQKEKGIHTLDFRNNNLSPGTYLLNFQSGDFVKTEKLVVLGK